MDRAPGVLWVAAGATLWGTDTVFRSLLTTRLGPVHIVLFEHLILAPAMLFILWRHRERLAGLGPRAWAATVAIAWGGSAVATVLFTMAIGSGNPTTAVLLQKLQPLVAVALARQILGERWPSMFPFVVGAAMVGAYLISFGGGNLLTPFSTVAAAPAAMATGAAVIWGASTVLGRWMSRQVPFEALTGLRIVGALPLLLVLSRLEVPMLPDVGSLPALLFIALVPGLAGLMLYYRGLQRTPAFQATVAELAFPATAALLNWTVLGAGASPVQVAGFLLVWSAIMLLRWRPALPAPVRS